MVIAVLLFFMPFGSADFWLILVSLVGLIGMHGVYWLITHPVNKFWVEGQDLSRVGAGFFAFRSKGRGADEMRPVPWTTLRDRWEYSHVARAALSTMSLVALVIAVT